MILQALTSCAAALLVTLVPPPPATVSEQNLVPVLEIIKAYGSLAGPECFGRTAPPGSSCQIPLAYIEKELGIASGSNLPSSHSITREDFYQRLESLPFRWPLKPFGLTEDSLRKTAVMNKGAETALYMDELERRGLYDRRNPAGPLPTSLRPQLNAQLDKEGIDALASKSVFYALSGGKGELTSESIKEAYRGSDALDYYGFIELVGHENISWPCK